MGHRQLSRLIISTPLSWSGCKNTWWSLPLPVRSASLKTFILIFSTSGLALHEGSAGICFCSSNLCRFWLAAAPHIKMPYRLDTSTFKKRNKKTVTGKKNVFKDFTSQRNVAKSTKGILNPIANDAKQVFLKNIGFSNKIAKGCSPNCHQLIFIFLWQRMLLSKWLTCPMVFPCLYGYVNNI